MEKLTQKELDEIIELHKDWLETKGRVGKQAVIIDKDLSGLRIEKADLTESAFKQCDMSNMKIYRAIFNGSEFNTVNLSKSSICECKMRVNLLSDVNLEDTLFCVTDLGHSQFVNGTDLSKACLQGTSLHLANTDKTYYKFGNYLNENTAVIYCVEDKLVSCGHYDRGKFITLEKLKELYNQEYCSDNNDYNKKLKTHYSRCIKWLEMMIKEISNH